MGLKLFIISKKKFNILNLFLFLLSANANRNGTEVSELSVFTADGGLFSLGADPICTFF